jgi:uncharacterized protein YlaN (UPF0358 family)
LEPETKYGVCVEAIDEAGNECFYPDEEIGYLIVTTKATDKEDPKVKSKRLIVSDVTTKSFVVSWEKATDDVTLDADMRYHVVLLALDNPEDPTIVIDETKTDIDTYTFTGLKPEIQYAVLVEAFDEVDKKVIYTDNEDEMMTVTTLEEKDTEKPTANSLQISAPDITDTSITLSWQAATDNKTARSEIKYDVYQDSKRIKQDLTSASSIVVYKVENLASGIQYSFYVVAKDKAGNETNYLTKTVETLDAIAPTVSSKEINVTNITANSITLSWQAATDNKTARSEIRYDVYQDSKRIKQDLTSASSPVTYKVENLVSGKQYSFFVVAKDKKGNEVRYNNATVNTKQEDSVGPKVSSRNIKVTKVAGNSISIEWEKATDNVTAPNNIRYEVALFEEGSGRWLTVRREKNIDSHTFTGLKPNTEYSFCVDAFDESGNVLHYPIDNGSMSARTAVNKLELEVKNNAEVLGGGVKCIFEWICVKYDVFGRLVEAKPQEEIMSFGSSAVKTRPISLPEGFSFKDYEIKLTIKSRIASVGGWKTRSSGYLDVSEGKLKLLIKGSVFQSKKLTLENRDGYQYFKRME